MENDVFTYSSNGVQYLHLKKALVFAKVVDEKTHTEIFKNNDFYVIDNLPNQIDLSGIDYYVRLKDNNIYSFNSKIAYSKYISISSRYVDTLNGKPQLKMNTQFISIFYKGYLCYLAVNDINLNISINPSKYSNNSYYIIADSFYNLASTRQQILAAEPTLLNYYNLQYAKYNNLDNSASINETVELLQPEYNKKYNKLFEFVAV